MKRRLILASASPARRRTLEAAGIDPEVYVSGVDESSVDATRPETLSLTLARLKALAVVERLRHHAELRGNPRNGRPTEAGNKEPSPLVLGCDSVLSFGEQTLGKPVDAADAIRRWQRMRGREGVLHTGHCLVELDTGKIAEAGAATVVRFADITDAEIEAYVATGEPLKVAGAFTIDGIGGAFVESINGDPGTVIGLSLPLFRQLLAQLGASLTELWRDQLASGP